jgi:hypothetical protein
MNSSFLSPKQKRQSLLLIGLGFIQLLLSQSAFAQPREIQGTVLNASGQPMAKATIVVKETKVGTSTDDAGKFSITAEIGQTLVVSAVGYVTQNVAITSASGTGIVLSPTTSSLDEVVVVGYTVQKRVSLTSAVSSISGEQLTTTKNENIVNTMTGKIPGLRVVQNTGEPDPWYGCPTYCDRWYPKR